MLAYNIYIRMLRKEQGFCSLINSYLRELGYQQLSYLFMIRFRILNDISKESNGDSEELDLPLELGGIGQGVRLFL